MSIYVPDEQGELTQFESIGTQAADQLSALPVSDLGGAFTKMLVTLVALVALLFISYWLLRRLIQNRLQKGVGNGSIQILEKKMISPKTMLYLVEVDQKKILLAESQLEIKKLSEASLPE